MLSEGDFSAQMSSMRSWLDARGCSPSKFDYDSTGETVIVKVEFSKDGEAEAFKQRFDGTAENLHRLQSQSAVSGLAHHWAGFCLLCAGPVIEFSFS